LADPSFQAFIQKLENQDADYFHGFLEQLPATPALADAEVQLIKKICQFHDLLHGIADSFQIHLLAAYAHELAGLFHAYYNAFKILDQTEPLLSQKRLWLVKVVLNTLELCLDLMGLAKPEKM
jgi:arginyl-tRNA synthetase